CSKEIRMFYPSEERLCPALGDLWTEQGPTDRAVAQLEQDGGPMSSGERVLLVCAWALWNGRGGVPLDGGINTPDRPLSEAGCTPLVACGRGDAAGEAWIRALDARRVRWPGVHGDRPACDGAPGPAVRAPRPHTDRPFCACPCADGVGARAPEDRVAAGALLS